MILETAELTDQIHVPATQPMNITTQPGQHHTITHHPH